MNLLVARGKDGGRDSYGVWDERVPTAVFNGSMRTYCTAHRTLQVLCGSLKAGVEFEENGYMYVWLRTSPKNCYNIVNQLYASIQNKKFKNKQ